MICSLQDLTIMQALWPSMSGRSEDEQAESVSGDRSEAVRMGLGGMDEGGAVVMVT
jgi:hypothetical protein